ncbi:MAG: UpxY family transcription antiterminator [Bacteroidales bacterium]|nr:UpxY family transcription antiterminator [Candidatus Liminaster caballi]
MNMQRENDDVQKLRGSGIVPPCAGVTPNVLPEVQTLTEEENSQTGVSTGNVPLKTIKREPKPETIPHWYVIRCTCGREQKAYELFLKNGIEAFYPTITRTKTIDGKIETVVESRLPNILFAYGSFNQLKEFVYQNGADTKYLRFYYNIHHNKTKEPLVIPQWQMNTLMKICDAEAEDKQLEPFVVEKFKEGQLVRVKDGPFAGVEGIVKRYKGQQRIGIVVEGLFTITTAYVAKDKLELVNEKPDNAEY